MSFRSVGLGKLLMAMYAAENRRITELRKDIRYELKKANGSQAEGDGGDFYVPFWSDAKNHVAGHLNLRVATDGRISKSAQRTNLYPKLRDGFLLWWDEKRRLRNVPFSVFEARVKGRYEAPGLGTIKVENTLAITVGDDGHRVIYPYFYEDPPLTEETARIGLWVMSQCIDGYPYESLRLLDVVRGRTFSQLDTVLRGDEESIFLRRYERLLREWDNLHSEYD